MKDFQGFSKQNKQTATKCYKFLFHNLVTFRIPFWQHSLHDVSCVFLQTSGFEGILDQPENEKNKKKMSSQRKCVYFSITVVDVQQLRYSEPNINITVSPKIKLYFFTLKFLSFRAVVSFTGQQQLQNGTRKIKEEGRRESEGCKSRRQCHFKTQKLPSNFYLVQMPINPW